MMFFDLGETTICWVDVMQEVAGEDEYADPDSLKISIWDEDDTQHVNAADMTKYDTGMYYYDFDTTDKPKGAYRAEAEGTAGSRKMIVTGAFRIR